MAWRIPQRAAVCMLLKLQPFIPQCDMCRALLPLLIKRGRWWSHGQTRQSSSEHGDASFNHKHLVGKQHEISPREAFQPGLFHIDISSFKANEQTGHGEEEVTKRPYINYGTHRDPAVFQQLSRGLTLGEDDVNKEIFNPKLTPRQFYLEAVEYENTAIIYPRVGAKEIVAGTQSMQRRVENLLDLFELEAGVDEQDLQELLQSLDKCSDEFLLGLSGDSRFNKLTDFLGERCFEFETQEFIKALVLFARAQIRTSAPAVQIFKTECEKRCPNWNVQTSLLVCDAWRLIGFPVKSLNIKIFGHIDRHLDQLTKHQVVQLMYLIGENRHCPECLQDSLQELVLKYMSTMTLTELGTVCQGFFKSKTNVKPPLVSALFRRIQSDHLDHVHSFYLVGILKVFRQAYFGHRDLFNHIGDAISPRLHTFSISSVMHVLLTYATLHIHNERLLEAGVRELLHRCHECRCKDLSKFVWSFATLNHHPEDSERFFKALIGRMAELIEEYEDFPVFLVSGLLSLAYLNIYPAELLSIVFSEKFLLKIDEYAKWSNINPQRDLFLLHSSVKIDCPDYQGNRLSKDFFLRKPLSPRMFGSLPYELCRRPILGQVASSVASALGGEQYIKLGFSLPHMKSADIEIRVDSDNDPIPFGPVGQIRNPTPSKKDQCVPLNQSLITSLTGRTERSQTTPTGNRMASSTPNGMRTARESGQRCTVDNGNLDFKETGAPSDRTLTAHQLVLDRAVLLPQDTSVKLSRLDLPKPLCSKGPGQENRIFILVWSRNHFHFNGKKLLGLHSMKRRQLQKLGYKTVDIPFFEWDKLSGSQAQEEYIRQKIFSDMHANNL